MNLNKNALSDIVILSLVLLITISAFVGFERFYLELEDSVLVEKYSHDIINENSIRFLDLHNNVLYIRNFASENISFNKIKIENNSCEINATLKANSLTGLVISKCDLDLNQKRVMLGLWTNHSIFEDYLIVDPNENLMTIDFKLGNICDIGYTRIYGLENFQNAHAENGNSTYYTYSVCLMHRIFSLSNKCEGNYYEIFYLDDTSNAHAYTKNTSSYVSQFKPVCISSNLGYVVTNIAEQAPDSTSVCIGSFEYIDDITGAHMGNCEAYNQKIWFNIHQ